MNRIEEVKKIIEHANENGYDYSIRNNQGNIYLSMQPIGNRTVYADSCIWNPACGVESLFPDELALFPDEL